MCNNGFVLQLMERYGKAEKHKVAFSLYDGSKVTDITYHRFLEDIQKSTGYFIRRNIKGQHIAIASENSYDWLVVFFGITGSGNVAVLLNQDLPEEVVQQCNQADVSILCSKLSNADKFGRLGGIAFLDFENIMASAPVPLDLIYASDPDEPVAMMCTSGTTGKSKIVVYSGRNLQASAENMQNKLACAGTNRMFLTLPLYHISGLAASVAHLWGVREICLGRGMRYILSDLSILNPTYIPIVPTVFESMVKLLREAKTTEARRKIIGSNLVHVLVCGASIPSTLCRYMMDQGIIVNSLYGMTESTASGTCCTWDEGTLGSIGKPYGSTQCRIENGELLLKGPSIMKGYYKDPEATAAIIQDGWLHTGDLAYCDENGYYYLTGRKKNVIILANGENVNPEEIEEKLSECPDILESLVYSDGKKICADIYTNDGLAAADFVRKYNDGVPLYRQIHSVNYTSAPLEKTGSGKIKRKEAAHESQGN